MCMIDDADSYYEVSTEKHVKARKTHACDVCRTPIQKGERYYRVSGLMEGRWDVWAYCTWCSENVLDWLTDECGGYCHGGQQEDLEEHRDEMAVRIGCDPDGFSQWLRWARVVVGLRRRQRGQAVAA